MKHFKASITIDAPAEKIWEILTDTTRWPEWDPSCERIVGTPRLGAKMTAYTKLAPGRGFGAKVTQFVPNQQMTWSSRMPLGLFRANREMRLVPKANGIEFTLQEKFEGPMMVLIGRTLPDLTPSFEGFVRGLKNRAEAARS